MPIAHRGMPPTGPNGVPYDDFSGAPVTAGSAVQDASDPYARSYKNPYNAYPSWAQQETPTGGSEWRRSSPDYQNWGATSGLTNEEVGWYGRTKHWQGPTRRNHVVEINDRAEQVAWADEGPLAKDLTPLSDGTILNEPQNFSGRWPIPRILRAGVGFTFFRTWLDDVRDLGGFNGTHVSLADNAVVLPVGGLQPNFRKNMRNTYRIEPEPWDLNLVDYTADPTANHPYPTEPVTPPNVYGSPYRLG